MKGKKAKIISIANQKGGVAKTTTAVNLSAALAMAGQKILVIDLDPQGNASTGLGLEQHDRAKSIYQVLIGKENIESAILPTKIDGLHLIPSDINLSAAEVEILSIKDKEYILKNAFSSSHLSYDYIFIDCPPSLGQLTLNALSSSMGVIIPMQCEFYALEGLSHLLKIIDIVQNNLNKSLKILGVLLTMYDKRNRLTEEVEADVRKYLGDTVFEVVIPRNVRIAEAPSHGKPVIIYDPSSIGSSSYHALAREFLNRERLII
ncbi:MAG: AAA family ATPase [Rickettsiaceae bacterium]|nr:AAA family ATPase [Rickettsiaceae bacterium]